MPARQLQENIFLPKAQNDRESAYNRAINDMYRILVRHINGHMLTGLIADRPASDGSLRFYWATDTTTLSIDGPAGWHNV